MNAKKCKAIRRVMRGKGIDPRQAVYIEGRKNKRLIPDGVDEQGKPKTKVFFYTGTIQLKADCGRALYRSVKGAA